MKKLLSLLSVLTISGTAVPTTIAASPYQKKENKDNLKVLNRKKRNLNFKEEIIRINNSDWHISTIAVDSQNNVYFGTNNGAYKLQNGSNNAHKISQIVGSQWEYNNQNSLYIKSIVIDNDDNVYFATNNNSLWVLKILNNLYRFIDKNNLQNINSNDDSSILNELNYLNPNLDISQLEVTNKTNTSAIIKTKNNSNKYLGEKTVYYEIDNQQNKIINLDELIKKRIFLNFRDKNKRIIIKKIENINTNNLIYSNITATKSIEPIYNKNSKSICFGTTTLFHNLPEKQNMKTPSCKYTKETTINTQITTGLSKEETNSQTKDMKHNWSFELGVNVHGEAGVWPFAKVSTDINTKIGTGGEYGSSETKTLSNKFDFSNSKTNEYKETSEVELPSQEISVNPNQKIKVTASLDEVLAQVTLNLKQNIHGDINATVITLNNKTKNITLSIKEIMQKIKQYDLLPQEITINNDSNISFNGKASRTLKQGFDGNIEFHEVK